jgi:hypothetical protein
MSFKDILVHVDSTPASRVRLNLALLLARRFGARVSGRHVIPEPDVPPYFKPSAVARIARIYAENAREAAGLAEALFREETKDAGVVTAWECVAGDMAETIPSCAAALSTVALRGMGFPVCRKARRPLPSADASPRRRSAISISMSASCAAPRARCTCSSPSITYVELHPSATMLTGAVFLRGVVAAFPYKLHTKEATVRAFHYETFDSLKAHLDAFITAYNFAKHLKSLRWRTPFQAICDAWTKDPTPFIINPQHLIPGPHT